MVRVTEDVFGTAVNPLNKQTEEIKRFTLQNDMEMKVQVSYTEIENVKLN